MKYIKSHLILVVVAGTLVCLQACKAKKLPPKPAEPQANNTPPPVQQPPAQPVATPQPPPPAPPKPDYNFTNVQFEFNSSALKTASYAVLDNAAAAMKADPTIKFKLGGYASIEGTEEHNTTLSEDRANAVKTYLVNSGVSSTQLITEGYGTANPVGDNGTEDGRALNRRVEIKKQ